MAKAAMQMAAAIWRFVVRHRVSIVDLGVLAFILAVAGYVAFAVDVFATEGQETTAQLTVELDEILLLGVLLTAGLLVFAVRRHLEQRREVARRMQAEHQARTLAYQDPLTGLPNRRQFTQALTLAVGQPPGAGLAHGLFLLDLNGFKQINDLHGHTVGDEVLVVFGQRLLQAAREADVVARLGGDEFAIVARDLKGPDAAAALARRIIDNLQSPVLIAGTAHAVAVGIGIALMEGEVPEEALRRADVALYRAKTERRSAFRFFDAEMDKMMQERDVLERELREALDAGRIRPVFQPALDLRSGELVGFEASPQAFGADGAPLPTERLIPIAEETGLIHRIADDNLRQAARAALSWPAHVILSVDIFSAQMRDPGLAGRMLSSLAEVGLPASRLEVEITESTVVRDLDAAKAIFGALRAGGARIALDNFGTGYSTLYHLRELNLDKIKIDPSFVGAMAGSGGSKVLAALAGLGHGLGLTVSVAGISDSREGASALHSGIEQGQGGAFGAPLSSEEAQAMAGVVLERRQVS